MEKRILCRFCLQDVEIDGFKAQRERHRSLAIFKCCQIHLDEKIKAGESFEWYYSQEFPTPFCSACFKLSENLWNLEEQFRQAKTALEMYIVTLTNEILLMRSKVGPDKSKNTEKSPSIEQSGQLKALVTETKFIDDLEDESSDHQELFVEDIKIKQEELEEGVSDEYFETYGPEDYDPSVSDDIDQKSGATVENDSPSDRKRHDFADNKNKLYKELRISLERLKLDSEGNVLLPDSKVRIRGQRKAAISANAAIRCITPDNFEESGPTMDAGDEDFSVTSDTEFRKDICVNREKTTKRSRKIGKFICIICETICRSKTAYKKHVNQHKGPFDCNICEIAYDSVYAFTQHMKIHNGGKLFNCDECEQSFVFKTSLISHKKRHDRAKMDIPYECYVCKVTFPDRTILSHHNRTVHKNDTYNCDSCKEVFNLFSKLQGHKIEVHGLPSPYNCPICKTVYKNSRCLRKHLRTLHATGVTSQEEATVCDICGKHYSRRFRMLEHRREVHFKNPNKHKRDKHNRDIAKGRDGKPKQTRRRTEVKRPVGKGLHPCQNCEKTFSCFATLENHIKVIHTKEVTFDCKLCHKKLASLSTLRSHMNDHYMSKTYKCEFCDRIFSQNYNRRSHIRRIHVLNKVPRKPYKRIALIPAPSSSSEIASESINLQQAQEKSALPIPTIQYETSNANFSNDLQATTSSNF